EVQVEITAPTGEAATAPDYFLSVPSPQIAGIPADPAGRSYLTDYMAVRLIAALARHISTSPEGYRARIVQAIQALGLANADPGFATSVIGQHQRDATAGAALAAPGNNAPARAQGRQPARVV